ncbi:EAL domain-containing protein [Bradyrhizobium sp. dw_411]|uniref:bifunctional diguanylate cyclase/phosphodiesterase n=1 Tax=Bradyrhizobium sp. dw_411 TaxID=2720082 RepID=UPI001BCEB6E6|nr:EAL domain-containing protein [Bradyrhizobium sp. dw_411]
MSPTRRTSAIMVSPDIPVKNERVEHGSTRILATWGIAGFIAIACAVLIGLAASHIISQRSDILADSRKDTANLTSSLIQHAELTFRTADAVLIGVVERLEHEPLDSVARERLRAWFTQEIQHSSQFISFAIIDAEGAMTVNAHGETDPGQFSDREFFIYHRTHDDRELHIGTPFRGRRTEGWIIPATRRVNRADGSFGGVAVAAINPKYFQDFYDRLELGKNGAVLLASSMNKTLLVRRPFVEANIGRDMTHSGLFAQLKKASVGSAEITASIDGIRRLNSYEQGHVYPIVVTVAQDVEELMAPWRQSAIRQMTQAIAIAIFIMLMGGFVWRATRTLAANSLKLSETNARFDAAVTNMSNGLTMFDADSRLMVWNEKYLELYGLSPDVVRSGASVRSIVEHRRQAGQLDLDVETYVGELEQTLKDTGRSMSTSRLNNGKTVSLTSTAITGGGWVAMHEDITGRVQHEEAMFQQAAELARTNMRFNAALSNMMQGLCMFDGQRQLVVWNDRFAELYQVPPHLLKVGTPYEDIIIDRISRGVLKGETSASAVKTRVAEMTALSSDCTRIDELADGRFVLLTRQPMEGGGWLAIFEDITERRRAEAEIVHLARHDVLTGLANRAEFNAKLEEASKRLKQNDSTVTVMMLDLDKFKAVNDTLGHPAGDRLLIEVGRRLQSTVRETDVLARLGGDEFAIIQESSADQHEGAITLALRIINAIAQPFDLNGHEASIGTSIGIALAPENGVEPEELLKSADLALYDAKANGRNDFRLYHPTMLEVAHTQQSAEGELRNAIAREEFELHYQPVVDVKTRRLCGVEALVRWRHPVKGLIAPDQFIPLAESTGLIVPLGDWVLQRACADAAPWPAHIKLAVNISAVQFKRGNLFDVILCTLVETGLAPERLELEITETSLLENQETHLATIRQLKNLGITIALDDFGTGYSSVTYLTSFPFDKIKIDKSFTQGALTRRDCAAVVSSVLALAHGLGMITTVEGIETGEQLKYMHEAGVDLAQGYLFGRPVPLSQLDLNPATLPNEMVA